MPAFSGRFRGEPESVQRTRPMTGSCDVRRPGLAAGRFKLPSIMKRYRRRGAGERSKPNPASNPPRRPQNGAETRLTVGMVPDLRRQAFAVAGLKVCG